MNRRVRSTSLLSIIVLLCFAVAALSQPQTVPWLADRPLDEAAYVTLAKEWKAYIDSHGESAHALMNLGMAYEYSGEQKAALIAAERAVELEPDNPRALFYYGKLLFKYDNDREKSLQLLERSREIAPDFERTLTMLAVVHMQRGDLNKAEQLFKTVHAQNITPRFLQDLAYNMLAGLPPGAVLITNGDNDTFPLLALQAGMDFRRDVVVVNRHLLNLENYRNALFERHPQIAPHKQIVQAKDRPVSPVIIRRMIEERRVPVYIASTVNLDEVAAESESCIEGINFCATAPHLTTEESARLFLDTYRLDSATDWGFAWDLMPALAHLASNYVGSIYRIAEKDDISPESKRLILLKAMHIAEFHEMDRLISVIRSLQKQ